MQVIKWMVFLVMGLAAILVGGGYLLSPNFNVSRSATIDAPADTVFALVADPKLWQQWAVWNQRDPAMAVTYSGAASGAGAAWAWQSKTQGDGTMTFTAAEPGRRLAYDLYFPDFGTTSTGELRLVAQGGSTQVTWVMSGSMGSNPLFRWVALNADNMIGRDLTDSLAGLKQLAEKN